MRRLALTRTAACVAGVVVCGALVTALQDQTSTSPQSLPRSPLVLRVAVDLVRVDAVVTDGRGRHVTDLTADDFEVLQDGRPQAITNFAYVATGRMGAADGPASPGLRSLSLTPGQVRRTLAIVVDDLGLSFESTVRVRQVLRQFIEREVEGGDLVAILRTGAGMGALQQFTTDRRILHAAVERVRWNVMARVPPFQAPTAEDARLQAGRNELFTAGTLGAIQYVVRGVAELPGRKSVVVLSDGFRLTDQDRRYGRIIDSVRALVDAATRAGVVIYTIDARGLTTTAPTATDPTRLSPDALLAARRDDLRATQDGLGVLAADTGGLFIHSTNDLGAGIRQVLDDQQGYYLLGYVPPGTTFSAAQPRFHSITVRVKRQGLRVRSRRGFVGLADDQPGTGTAANRMINAVSSPFAGGDIRLRLSAFFEHVATLGPVVQSYMHLDARDLTFTAEADGTRSAELELLAVTFGENGHVADEDSRRYTVRLQPEHYARALTAGFVYSARVALKRPGPYQLRIALRDVGSDRIGSASHFVDVPDVKKRRLTLSGLVIAGSAAALSGTSRGGAAADDVTADIDPNATIAVRAFRQGTDAVYACYVYNARRGPSGRPALTAEVRLYRDDLEVFRSVPEPVEAPPTADAPIIAGGLLRLRPTMPPGRYLLEVAVTDLVARKGSRATQTIDFEVVD